jgi:hypothetical protein
MNVQNWMNRYGNVHVYVDMTFISRYLKHRKLGPGEPPIVFNMMQVHKFITQNFHGNDNRHSMHFGMFFSADSEEAKSRIEKLINSEVGRIWEPFIDTTPSLIKKVTPNTPPHMFAYYLSQKGWVLDNVLNIFITDDPAIISHCSLKWSAKSKNLIIGPAAWAPSPGVFTMANASYLPITSFVEETGAYKPINGDGTNWIPLE